LRVVVGALLLVLAPLAFFRFSGEPPAMSISVVEDEEAVSAEGTLDELTAAPTDNSVPASPAPDTSTSIPTPGTPSAAVPAAPSATAPTPTTAPSNAGPPATAQPSLPTPNPPPASAPSAAAGGYPGVGSTGVPAGTVLRPSGSRFISVNGTVVDGYDVTGTITIAADDVVIRNTRVRSGDLAPIRIMNGSDRTIIEDVEIDGLGRGLGSSGILAIRGAVRRVNIHGVENGIVPKGDTLVEDSYIHDLAAPGAPHYDGIQIDGGQTNIIIRHNTIVAPERQTSAVMIGNYFGPVANVIVQGNYLAGGEYAVRADGNLRNGAITSVQFLSNRFGKSAAGPALIRSATFTQSGNIDDATGRALTLVPGAPG
jgi:hypothetical protein